MAVWYNKPKLDCRFWTLKVIYLFSFQEKKKGIDYNANWIGRLFDIPPSVLHFFLLVHKKSMVILLLANLILPELYNNMNWLGQFENKLNWFRHKHLTKRSEVRILPPLNVVVLKKVIWID